ncbi:hypothetical protein GALMADRAFT_223890 [Galerina marginata CBS 339.88]|uniref:BRCT domain-containing protein n=1 Tax=Galerina marginata (strain CBS 339.88) TaxID=685588 RepID=A0A067TI19_GALM3|nr:hypothetical protein GALMADRAFT_223890 [Galerina marginata CBS 339.88]
MRRRGNKSHKVPNVKLRPAEKGSYSRPIEESCWAQDTQPGSDDTNVFDACPRPLKGVAICATGVQDKPTLFKQAVELGATCTPAFTDRVTHLVAVDHGGAKYMCALERKVPIVKPSWISENYQIWLKGDDVDVVKSVEQHRLPVFSGVVVCPSGITDITRRTQISKIVTANDGEYLKSLERPVRVTHLLCSGDEETDKMRYAEKFNSRGEAKIHLVWEEWFWDSLDFGGRFDEATYQVSRPRPERKTLPGAPTSSPPPPPSSDVASEHDEVPSSSVAVNPPKPKGADDAEVEVPAFLNVLPAVTLQLWGSLLERRGYEVTDGEVLLSPSKAKANGSGKSPQRQPSSPVKPKQQQFGAARSVISQVRGANSFAPAVAAKPSGSSRQGPFRRTSTANGALGKAGSSKSALLGVQSKGAESSTMTSGAAGSSGTSLPKQIFAGMKIRVLGEAKTPTVRNAIEVRGGTMSVNSDEDVGFIIVRLVSGSKIYRDEDDDSLRAKYRTECWLEQCMFEDRICGPEEQISYVPLGIQIPVSGAEKLLISISGFDHSRTMSLTRLFRALGIVLPPVFTRRATHLLCPSGTGLKFEKAQEWGVPVINMQWLGAMASSGVIPPVHEYLVLDSIERMDVDVDRKDVKGKGKAVDKGKQRATSHDVDDAMDVEVEGKMNDITNEHNQSETKPHSSHKKAKTVERHPTTILPNPEPPEKFSFGLPNETLGGPSGFIQPSSLISPAPSISTPPVQGPRQESYTMPSRQGSFAYDHNPESHPPTNPNQNPIQIHQSLSKSSLKHRKSTILNIDAEPQPTHGHEQQQDGRIPSSKSPSPMKVQRTNSRLSLSPVKIDHEVTKALQESITSLLGKRPSPDTDEAGVSAGDIGGGGGRNGKRARPQRKKGQSRQPSDAKIGETSAGPRTRSARSANPPAAANFGDGAMNAFDAYPDQLNADNGKPQEETQESMRVMYEDPVQMEEKNRLMNLLKSQTAEEESNTLSGSERRSRRSMRIAGF